MLLERAARLCCYETRSERRNESHLDDPEEDTNRFPLFQLGDAFLEYQTPLRLGFGLLTDRMLERRAYRRWGMSCSDGLSGSLQADSG